MLYAVDDMRYVLKVNPELYYEAKDFTDVWHGRTYQARQTDMRAPIPCTKVVSCICRCSRNKIRVTLRQTEPQTPRPSCRPRRC